MVGREVEMPAVDYSRAGMLGETVMQTIQMIDSTILMDDEPMPAYIEARFAAMRRLLRGGLVGALAQNDEEEAHDETVSSHYDRHRWSCRIDDFDEDQVQVSATDHAGRIHQARLPYAMVEDLDPMPGMDIVIRLIDDGRFLTTLATDAPAPRNDTNPCLHRRDVQTLQRLMTGLRRSRDETRKPQGEEP